MCTPIIPPQVCGIETRILKLLKPEVISNIRFLSYALFLGWPSQEVSILWPAKTDFVSDHRHVRCLVTVVKGKEEAKREASRHLYHIFHPFMEDKKGIIVDSRGSKYNMFKFSG